VHLRIDDLVTDAAARLTTDWAGSPLVGRVSHPSDDSRSFMNLSRYSLLSDQQGLVALGTIRGSDLHRPKMARTLALGILKLEVVDASVQNGVPL
jgi:hypothetical protein